MWMLALISALLSADPVPGPVWQTPMAVSQGGDTKFLAKGTKKGVRYLFRARGICDWRPTPMPLGDGTTILRKKSENIFGIEFWVTFGAQDHKILSVGDRKVDESEIDFVADANDVPIRIQDHWDLPEDVTCRVDGISVWPGRKDD